MTDHQYDETKPEPIADGSEPAFDTPKTVLHESPSPAPQATGTDTKTILGFEAMSPSLEMSPGQNGNAPAELPRDARFLHLFSWICILMAVVTMALAAWLVNIEIDEDYRFGNNNRSSLSFYPRSTDGRLVSSEAAPWLWGAVGLQSFCFLLLGAYSASVCRTVEHNVQAMTGSGIQFSMNYSNIAPMLDFLGVICRLLAVLLALATVFAVIDSFVNHLGSLGAIYLFWGVFLGIFWWALGCLLSLQAWNESAAFRLMQATVNGGEQSAG